MIASRSASESDIPVTFTTFFRSCRMSALSDAERLAIIDQSYKRLLEYRNLVQYYTDKNISVSYLRAKKKKDADRVVALYGDAEDRYW